MQATGRAPRPTRGLAVLAVLALLVAGGLSYGITRAVRSASSAPTASRVVLPKAVSALAATPRVPDERSAHSGPVPVPAAVAAALRPGQKAPGLGRRLLAHVVDAATGTVLYDAAGDTPAAPASTAKLMTAAAVLATYLPTARFTTSVVKGADGAVVLVGGGDPTLTAARPGAAPPYPGAARLADLARQVRSNGLRPSRIVVDDSRFTGPSINPNWDRSDMGTDYAGPITALMVDGGRAAPADYARSLSPDVAAGKQFAAALGSPHLTVSRGTAPRRARVIARVQSAPVLDLITEMLQASDNVIAEVLARQVALAQHRPASFAGATAAIRTVLARLGVQVGTGMRDGSGLSSADRVAPDALTGVLRLIAGHGPRRAPALQDIVAALPVAGWSGTLADRYLSGRASVAAGLVRAKTGTLSSVASLAGFVYDRSGRLLIFSFDADRAVSTDDADAALDQLVAALAGCGCS